MYKVNFYDRSSTSINITISSSITPTDLSGFDIIISWTVSSYVNLHCNTIDYCLRKPFSEVKLNMHACMHTCARTRTHTHTHTHTFRKLSSELDFDFSEYSYVPSYNLSM